MRYTITAALLGLAGLIAVQPASAQQTVQCGQNEVAVASLGLGGLECSNCILFHKTGEPGDMRWLFRSEPTVLSVKPDGPAAGRLRAGDVVVSIDGYLVTTQEGGRRMAQPLTGQAAQLRIRRDGREMDVSVTPVTDCQPVPDVKMQVFGRVRPSAGIAPPLDVASVRPPEAVAPPVRLTDRATGVRSVMPRGSLGVSLSCEGCGVQIIEDSARIWSFSEPPTVVSVEAGSPAARTGLRSGDRIVTIDGVAITTATGGTRFGAVAPGERVRLGVVRGGTDQTFTVTAIERGAGIVSRAPNTRAEQSTTTRFSGRLGATMIDVTGEPVVVTQTDTEIIIRSGGITVRLRRDTSRIR